jgi:hypothetical protein
MMQPSATAGPVLMTVANTVAVVPTATERLDGSTAATRDWDQAAGVQRGMRAIAAKTQTATNRSPERHRARVCTTAAVCIEAPWRLRDPSGIASRVPLRGDRRLPSRKLVGKRKMCPIWKPTDQMWYQHSLRCSEL